jgi:hypothetical protein
MAELGKILYHFRVFQKIRQIIIIFFNILNSTLEFGFTQIIKPKLM